MRSPTTRRQALLLAVGIAAAFGLAACGRKSDPERPEDADPAAPRRYPVDRGRPAQRDQVPLPEPPPVQSSPFLYR